jgi:hypothetical protein
MLGAEKKVEGGKMLQESSKTVFGVLDPMERISEVLFGLIVALTFTLTLGIGTADDIKIRTNFLRSGRRCRPRPIARLKR